MLELRLQKARAMLADSRHDRLRVIEVAYACGFNAIAYFNQCFRRRFGGSPTQYRGGNGEVDKPGRKLEVSRYRFWALTDIRPRTALCSQAIGQPYIGSQEFGALAFLLPRLLRYE